MSEFEFEFARTKRFGRLTPGSQYRYGKPRVRQGSIADEVVLPSDTIF